MIVSEKTCKVDGCSGKGRRYSDKMGLYLIKGYCNAHYIRLKRYGRLEPAAIRGENRSNDYLYKTYNRIKDRCYRESCQMYYTYGGRGIKVCDEWLGINGFTNFRKYVADNMGERPTKKHSIDRIDVDKDYEPGNIRWANGVVQAINRGIMKNNTSGYVGVSYVKQYNLWIACIGVNNRRIHLGSAKTKEEAVMLRDYGVQKYHKPILEQK